MSASICSNRTVVMVTTQYCTLPNQLTGQNTVTCGVSSSVTLDLMAGRSGPVKNLRGRMGLACSGHVSEREALGLRGGGGEPSGIYTFLGLHLRGR